MSTCDTRTYSINTSRGFVNKAALKVRKQIYHTLESLIDLSQVDSVLDVGVTADRKRLESNFFEEMFPYPERVTALSDQDASWMEKHYPGLRFVQGDGRQLPFPDNSYDLVFSSAVIEHVGNESNQRRFIEECCRVSKKHVFLTTPNRWHPVEAHTILPLMHWLPKKIHRVLLGGMGFDFFAKEENLNLLGKRDLEHLCRNLGITPHLHTVSFFGIPSNLLMHIQVGGID